MKILILDTYNEIHRAKTAFVKGDYFIIFNFFRNLKVLVETFTPNRIFFALEGYPKFRYDLYPEYKKNRRIIKIGTELKKAQELEFFNSQKDKILELSRHLPIVQVVANDYESDDVINTLVHDLQNEEEIIIISNDHDYVQLLQHNFSTQLKIFNPRTKSFLEAPSYHYLTWKSLAGDKSDNITGIITPLQAEKIATSPNELDQFLTQPENYANFKLNMDLINLRTIPSEDLRFTEYQINFEKLKTEFEKMEFSSMLTEKYWTKFVSIFTGVK